MQKIEFNKNLLVVSEFYKDLPNVYFVGGCIRDLFLGINTIDIDLASPNLPVAAEKYVTARNKKVYRVGKKFGTIGMTMGNLNVEITTFRSEIYNFKNRYPEVVFTDDLYKDLERRDFTINSIACDFSKNIHDPFNGISDLNNRILKCVGNANDRFREDPLRILRAIRFKYKYNLKFEKNTLLALRKNRYNLLYLSKERIIKEFEQIFILSNSAAAIRFMFKNRIMNVLFPELSVQYNFEQNSPYHEFVLHKHTIKVFDLLRNSIKPSDQDFADKLWVALFHDIGKPFTKTNNKKGYSNYIGHDLLGAEITKSICKRYSFSNESTKFITNSILNHLSVDSWLRSFDNRGKKCN